MTTVLLFKWTNTFYDIWWASSSTPYPNVRFIPHRQFCLPKMAHIESTLFPKVLHTTIGSYPFKVWEQVEDNTPPIPLIIRFTRWNLCNSSYPEGNFRGNQLLDGSISLSPLYSSMTNDLHVSTAASLHQSFPWFYFFSSIVHHLSGPSTYAQTQTSHYWLVGCWCTHPIHHFHCAI